MTRKFCKISWEGELMANIQDIDLYLDECNFPFESLDKGLWRIESPEDRVENIMLQYVDPILYVTLRLFKVPDKPEEDFYKKLLKLNSEQMTHGAFAIDDDDFIILIDTLEVENLDLNELKASVQAIAFNAVQYYKELASQ